MNRPITPTAIAVVRALALGSIMSPTSPVAYTLAPRSPMACAALAFAGVTRMREVVAQMQRLWRCPPFETFGWSAPRWVGLTVNGWTGRHDHTDQSICPSEVENRTRT